MSELATCIRRHSTGFSPDGSRAACLTDDGRTLDVEVWDLADPAGAGLPLPVDGGETIYTQVLPLPRGRALLVRHGTGGHELVLLASRGGRTVEHPLATVTAPGFRMLTPRLAVSWAPGGDSALWRMRPTGPALDLVTEIRGVVDRGVALDVVGHRLGFTRLGADGPAATVLDLRTGCTRDLLPGAPAHVLLADPGSGRIVLAMRTADGPRLAVHQLREATTTILTADPAAVLPPGPAADGTVRPLAMAPGGRRLALQVDHGAGSRLLVHDLEADRLTPVAVPGGVLGGTAVWAEAGLRFPFSGPDCPSAIATVVPGDDGAVRSWQLAGVGAGRWSPAHLEHFALPGGTVEAVVHGDWRTAEHVVVALHGGPAAHWDLDFQPTLQLLARPGWAVVAPNQRGSTGYGAAHAAAVHGAWGGPDLDDVTAIGRLLRAARPAGTAAPALVGESYGGYLALLGAAGAPELWSRCVAVAPFLSGARLYPEASAAVRTMIDERGGRGPACRDVAAVAHHLGGRLLVLHGDADDVVPVGQSRLLRTLLRRGGRDGEPHHLEIPGGGHDLLTHPAAADALVRFLDGPRRPQSPAAVRPRSTRNTTERKTP